MWDAFKQRNNHEIVKTIFIDKDLQEVEVLQVRRFSYIYVNTSLIVKPFNSYFKAAFPNAHILLCHNHCKSAFHTKLKKTEIKTMFENLMNADSEGK
jgi:hypothetical protein